MNFMGYTVTVVEDTPGYVMSKDLPISPEMRASMEAWILTFFTPKNTLMLGEVINLGHEYLMNPRTLRMLRDTLSKMGVDQRNLAAREIFRGP